MTRVLIHLKLEDYKQWRPMFDQLASARREMGSLGGELLRGAHNPQEVFILWNWEDLKGAREYFEMREWRDLMQSFGAVEPPDVHILDIIEKVQV